MRKTFDKSSGAIIYNHTKDELKQVEALRNVEKTKVLMEGLCKILSISQEDLQAAISSVDVVEVEEE